MDEPKEGRNPPAEKPAGNLVHYRPIGDIRPKTPEHPIVPHLLRQGLVAPAGERPSEPTEPVVAILVCHGMGQQVRYETISSLANCLREEVAEHGGTSDPVEVNLSYENQSFLPRAELNWSDRDKQRHHVHIYEAYWAPLTEGKVSYWDTILFLLSGAWNGVRYSLKGNFQRWMFGGTKTLPIRRFTLLGILLMLVVVLLQVLIIGYLTLVVGAKYATLARNLPTMHTSGFFHTWLAWLMPLFPDLPTLLNPTASAHDRIWAMVKLLGWFAMIAEALYVRYFLIQYVGDVAAYISPYKDSKFDELRHQIQAIGLQMGKIVYGFGKPDSEVPHYDKIVVVGHSLGSVLAYDTLNALINLDNVSAGDDRRDVVNRTRALITFGSPLDKTAFIFRMQAAKQETWIREQLAASVQPLILDYGKFRVPSFHWVNLWSHMDVISGSLDYYDDPDLVPNPRHLENLIDHKAWCPIGAHVQYWNNPLLRQQLYKYVTQLQPDGR